MGQRRLLEALVNTSKRTSEAFGNRRATWKEDHPLQKNAAVEFDAYGQSYNETLNRAVAFSGLKVDFFTRVKVDYFGELLDALASSVARAEVVDVGCGVANSHPLLAERVGRLVGVDVSKACIAKAAADNPKNEYKVYDGRNLPYPDAAFDAASAVCVFHHVPITERLRLANDIRRVLRPGGLFAVFEHNSLNPLTRYAVSHCEFDKDAVLLRRQETESLLKDAGFQQIYSRFILTIPAKGSLLREIDRLFAHLPVGAQYYTVGRVGS
jgi:SAM-dependent methyltransferase